ncbi:MAG: hypothetical protein ACP5HU_05585 [Phycisphaerae bacterium]
MAWKTDLDTDKMLGQGIYAPCEAGAFIGVKSQQIVRWVHGTKGTQPVVTPQFKGHREVISFLDMVQAMAIRDMRGGPYRIPLQRIRKALAWVRNHHPEIEYPFAIWHRTFIITHTKEIAILLEQDDPEHLLQISGDHAGQYVHATILDEYLDTLQFGSNGQASRYIPLQAGGYKVVMDPEIRCGQPIVEPTGYLVEALADAAVSEGGVANAADWYGIDEKAVSLACDYHRRVWGSMYAQAS